MGMMLRRHYEERGEAKPCPAPKVVEEVKEEAAPKKATKKTAKKKD